MKIIVEAASLEELKVLLEKLTDKVSIKTINENRHIDTLPMAQITRTTLRKSGIETLDQLLIMSENDLLRLPRLGRKMASEIRGVLNVLGHTPT